MALLQPFGQARDLLAHAVDGGRGTALRPFEPLGEPVGHAGDLVAEALQGLGLGVLGAGQAGLDGAGDAGDLAADQIDGLGAALLGGREAAVDRLGHGDDLAADPVDGLAPVALGGLDPERQAGQPLLGLAAGGLGQADRELRPDALHIARKAARQRLEAGLEVGDALVQARLGLGGGLEAGDGLADGRLGAVRRKAGRKVRSQLGHGRRGQGGDLVGIIILEDDPVQPLAERHAGTAGKLFRDLAGLGVDPLDAPGRPRAHPNRISAFWRKLSVDSWGVNEG